LGSRGQCREVVWAYNPNLPCNNNGTMPPNARADAAHYKLALASLSPQNVAAIKSALAGLRPVGISIPAYTSWYSSPETTRAGRGGGGSPSLECPAGAAAPAPARPRMPPARQGGGRRPADAPPAAPRRRQAGAACARRPEGPGRQTAR